MGPYFQITRALIVLEGIALTGNPDFDLFSSSYVFAFRRAVNLFGISDLHQVANDIKLFTAVSYDFT
jgi:hypothetical protein